ncbi:conserved hypothetical protein [Trichinella spiralis]|uniref:hypothetical protein n=1 Tax=Trichinella spiralis TaxID=6334 RepID=UPI0001EFD7CA|nr:conserved hypothetical protein [Trichinella spiralis]
MHGTDFVLNLSIPPYEYILMLKQYLNTVWVCVNFDLDHSDSQGERYCRLGAVESSKGTLEDGKSDNVKTNLFIAQQQISFQLSENEVIIIAFQFMKSRGFTARQPLF